MRDVYLLTIDGQQVDPGQSFEVLNPATFGCAGRAAQARLEDLEAAIRAAQRAFVDWSARPEADWRGACLAIADAIHTHAAELADLLTAEQGKPLEGIGSRMELAGFEAMARFYAGLDLPSQDRGGVRLEYRPLGVIGSITPWNFPLMIMANNVLPAIRMGNSVVVKPSPYTPLSSLRAVEIIAAVLPPGLVNIVSGDNALGAALTAHPGVAKIAFTGSSPTGRAIMAAAAPTLKRLTLELGGNDAGIVLDDADPKTIAKGLFWGAFINNGQTCGALKRLYVHETLFEPAVAALAEIASAVQVGNGTDLGTVLGPIQNKMQYERVCALLSDALAQGAKAITGGLPVGEQAGYFVKPTLVVGAKKGMALVDQEQFGPVLPIIAYSDLDDVIAQANDNPNGLGGSVWSSDLDRAHRVARRLETGTVWINQHGVLRPDVPFGGVKQSGIGLVNGPEGLAEYARLQVIAPAA